MADAAFAGFESKWIAALPEFGLALRFVDPANRTARAALACIGYEIEHAASHIGEAEVAAGKLRWWLEELDAFAAGAPRHPLTRALAAEVDARRVPHASWHGVIAAALARLDDTPATTLDALLDAHRDLHRHLAEAGRALFADDAVAVVAEAGALRRILRDAFAAAHADVPSRLVLPLELLARHRLTRADLAITSPSREAALREFAALLAVRLDAIDRAVLPVIDAVAVHAERARCGKLARAREPLRLAASAFTQLPLSAAWQGWRAARRHAHAALLSGTRR
ncbi:MAG TPA: squalene/phytoene synthase family protein [Dokdonella sp.]|uniref:squalene/phytoene synthase family protein n=1 Tax=Dokdonella sp. TaxID=2291710 RepID=UPI0025B7E5FF|nr:squalene/phytoene synthase family protein [Dokdonella sp.]MBX3692164.1 squalene/phytoene synthase family protein [Dokdonella sp.]MCW5567790.1 squalene/phytoene synthase family protein [Dokdonella sp.]HNR92323.1 squalene/phytoene synthase family protein [Dokdonella sp.]